jgi:hypothetical protein
MLQNLIFNIQGKRTIASSGNVKNNNSAPQYNEATIDDLYNHLRSGLWGLLIFLGVSVIALYFRKQSLAGTLPADIMELLGSTPPVILINCVFGASTLSSLLSIAGRIYHNLKPGKTSIHLWFRVFFYLLYFISGALSDYFNVVFISGLVVLGLQHYNVWNYYMRAIEKNTGKCIRMSMYSNWLSKK